MSKWQVDAAHTQLGFSVRHMMISKVKGSFSGFEGVIVGDPADLANANISFTIDTSTIQTNNKDRDDHLRSEDFFDVATYPQMKFVSTNIVKTGENQFDLTGDLTIKDVTESITLKTTFEGSAKNPWGVEVAAFEAEGEISRKAFGLTWNQALEAGGVLVGDDISINIELQANPAE